MENLKRVGLVRVGIDCSKAGCPYALLSPQLYLLRIIIIFSIKNCGCWMSNERKFTWRVRCGQSWGRRSDRLFGRCTVTHPLGQKGRGRHQTETNVEGFQKRKRFPATLVLEVVQVDAPQSCPGQVFLQDVVCLRSQNELCSTDIAAFKVSSTTFKQTNQKKEADFKAWAKITAGIFSLNEPSLPMTPRRQSWPRSHSHRRRAPPLLSRQPSSRLSWQLGFDEKNIRYY